MSSLVEVTMIGSHKQCGSVQIQSCQNARYLAVSVPHHLQILLTRATPLMSG
jgi:hypothetical protein